MPSEISKIDGKADENLLEQNHAVSDAHERIQERIQERAQERIGGHTETKQAKRLKSLSNSGVTAFVWTVSGVVLAACSTLEDLLGLDDGGGGGRGGNSVSVNSSPVQGARVYFDINGDGTVDANDIAIQDQEYPQGFITGADGRATGIPDALHGRKFVALLDGAIDTDSGQELAGQYESFVNEDGAHTIASPITDLIARSGNTPEQVVKDILTQGGNTPTDEEVDGLLEAILTRETYFGRPTGDVTSEDVMRVEALSKYLADVQAQDTPTPTPTADLVAGAQRIVEAVDTAIETAESGGATAPIVLDAGGATTRLTATVGQNDDDVLLTINAISPTGAPIAYTVAGAASQTYQINPRGGISVREGVDLQAGTTTIAVAVSSGGETTTVQVEFTIQAALELTPPAATPEPVLENEAGAVVIEGIVASGTATANDFEIRDAFGGVSGAGYADMFEMVQGSAPNTWNLKLRDGESLDFEVVPAGINLRVFVRPAGNAPSNVLDFTITVLNDPTDIAFTGNFFNNLTEDARLDGDNLVAQGAVSIDNRPAGQDVRIAGANVANGVATVTLKYGTLVYNLADDSWVYTADNTQPAVQGLLMTQSLTDIVEISIGGASRNIIINILGRDEDIYLADANGARITSGVAVNSISIADSDFNGNLFLGDILPDVEGQWNDNNPVEIRFADSVPDSLTDVFALTSAGRLTFTGTEAEATALIARFGNSITLNLEVVAPDDSTATLSFALRVNLVADSSVDPIDPVDPPVDPDPEPEPEPEPARTDVVRVFSGDGAVQGAGIYFDVNVGVDFATLPHILAANNPRHTGNPDRDAQIADEIRNADTLSGDGQIALTEIATQNAKYGDKSGFIINKGFITGASGYTDILPTELIGIGFQADLNNAIDGASGAPLPSVIYRSLPTAGGNHIASPLTDLLVRRAEDMGQTLEEVAAELLAAANPSADDIADFLARVVDENSYIGGARPDAQIIGMSRVLFEYIRATGEDSADLTTRNALFDLAAEYNQQAVDSASSLDGVVNGLDAPDAPALTPGAYTVTVTDDSGTDPTESSGTWTLHDGAEITFDTTALTFTYTPNTGQIAPAAGSVPYVDSFTLTISPTGGTPFDVPIKLAFDSPKGSDIFYELNDGGAQPYVNTDLNFLVSPITFTIPVFEPTYAITDAAEYGAFRLDVNNGAWTYDLNENAAAVAALASGSTLTDTIMVSVSVGGTTETRTIEIAITRNGDAYEIASTSTDTSIGVRVFDPNTATTAIDYHFTIDAFDRDVGRIHLLDPTAKDVRFAIADAIGGKTEAIVVDNNNNIMGKFTIDASGFVRFIPVNDLTALPAGTQTFTVHVISDTGTTEVKLTVDVSPATPDLTLTPSRTAYTIHENVAAQDADQYLVASENPSAVLDYPPDQADLHAIGARDFDSSQYTIYTPTDIVATIDIGGLPSNFNPLTLDDWRLEGAFADKFVINWSGSGATWNLLLRDDESFDRELIKDGMTTLYVTFNHNNQISNTLEFTINVLDLVEGTEITGDLSANLVKDADIDADSGNLIAEGQVTIENKFIGDSSVTILTDRGTATAVVHDEETNTLTATTRHGTFTYDLATDTWTYSISNNAAAVRALDADTPRLTESIAIEFTLPTGSTYAETIDINIHEAAQELYFIDGDGARITPPVYTDDLLLDGGVSDSVSLSFPPIASSWDGRILSTDAEYHLAADSIPAGLEGLFLIHARKLFFIGDASDLAAYSDGITLDILVSRKGIDVAPLRYSLALDVVSILEGAVQEDTNIQYAFPDKAGEVDGVINLALVPFDKPIIGGTVAADGAPTTTYDISADSGAEYGTLTLDTDTGAWEYDLDTSIRAVANLAASATLTETITVTGTAAGVETDRTITITIGRDADGFTLDSTGATITETQKITIPQAVNVQIDTDSGTAEGVEVSVLGGAVNAVEGTATPPTDFSTVTGTATATIGTIASVNAGGNGFLSYRLGTANRPEIGEEVTESITVTLTPTDGGADFVGVIDVIFGRDADGNYYHDLGDGARVPFVPNLNVTLAIAFPTTYTVTDSADYGTFTLNARTREWTYDLNENADAVASLASGATLTDTIIVTGSDSGTKETRTIDITITRTGDSYEIATTSTDTTSYAAGYTIQGKYGTMDYYALTNSWTYELDHSDPDTIAVVETLAAQGWVYGDLTGEFLNQVITDQRLGEVIVFEYTAEDGTARTSEVQIIYNRPDLTYIEASGNLDPIFATYETQTPAAHTGRIAHGIPTADITDITILTNDELSGTVNAPTQTTTYTVAVEDSDGNALTLGANGWEFRVGDVVFDTTANTWTYTPDGFLFPGIGVTNTQELTITITPSGGADPIEIPFTLFLSGGEIDTFATYTVNDGAQIPVIFMNSTPQPFSGFIPGFEPTYTITDAAEYGTFTFDPATLKWDYDFNEAHADVAALAIGETLTDTIIITGSQMFADDATTTITINIERDNDGFTFTDATGAEILATSDTDAEAVNYVRVATDFSSSLMDGRFTATNPAGRTHSLTDDVEYGVLLFELNTGIWRYHLDPQNEAVKALEIGATLTDNFALTINVAGQQAPINVAETITIARDQHGVFFADANGARINHIPTDKTTIRAEGEYGTLTYNVASGKWQYTIDEDDPDTIALGDANVPIETFILQLTEADGTITEHTIRTGDYAIAVSANELLYDFSTDDASKTLLISAKSTPSGTTATLPGVMLTYTPADGGDPITQTFMLTVNYNFSTQRFTYSIGGQSASGIGTDFVATFNFLDFFPEVTPTIPRYRDPSVTILTTFYNDDAAVSTLAHLAGSPLAYDSILDTYFTIGTDGEFYETTLNADGTIATTATTPWAGDTPENYYIIGGNVITTTENAAENLLIATTSYGTFEYNTETRDWRFIVDNNDPDIQALGGDDSITETITLQFTHADGTTTTETITVTINGTEEEIYFADADGNRLDEIPAVLGQTTTTEIRRTATFQGQVDAVTPQPGADYTVKINGDLSAGATLTFDTETNTWTYTNPTLNYAKVNDMVNSESVTLTITPNDPDSQPITVPFELQIKDPLLHEGPFRANPYYDFDGVLTQINLPGQGAGVLLPITDAIPGLEPIYTASSGTYGSFNIDPTTGAWTYTLYNDVEVNGVKVIENLGIGDSLTDIITVTAHHKFGGTTTEDIAITIRRDDDGIYFENLIPTAPVSGSRLNAPDPVPGATYTAEVIFDEQDILFTSIGTNTGTITFDTTTAHTFTWTDHDQFFHSSQLTSRYIFRLTPTGGGDPVDIDVDFTIGVHGGNYYSIQDNPNVRDGTVAGDPDSANFGIMPITLTIPGLIRYDAITMGQYGSVEVNTDTGEWFYTIDPSNAAVLGMAIGDSLTETITINGQHIFGGAAITDTITVYIGRDANGIFHADADGDRLRRQGDEGPFYVNHEGNADDTDDSRIIRFDLLHDGSGEERIYFPHDASYTITHTEFYFQLADIERGAVGAALDADGILLGDILPEIGGDIDLNNVRVDFADDVSEVIKSLFWVSRDGTLYLAADAGIYGDLNAINQALTSLEDALTLDLVVSAPRDTAITLPYRVTVNLVDEVNNDKTPDMDVVIEGGGQVIDLTQDGGHLATISYYDADAYTGDIAFGLLPDSHTDANGNIIYSGGMDAATYTAHLSLLAIDEESGQIHLQGKIPQNAQDFPLQDFRVVATVTDNGVRVAREILTIDVDGNGINLPPAFLDDQITLNLNEGATKASAGIITTLIAVDTTPVAYEITAGNDAGLFTINGNNGRIRLAENAKLDYDTAESHTLTITASSNGGTATATVTINVIDKNEGEAGYAILQNGDMLELQQAFTDPDGVRTISYQWFTTTDGGETKTAITGAIATTHDTDNTPAAFDTYEFEVIQIDHGTLTVTADGAWSYTRNAALDMDTSENEHIIIRISPEGTDEIFDRIVSLEVKRDNAGDYSYIVGDELTTTALATYNTPITGTIAPLPTLPAGTVHGVTVSYTDNAGIEYDMDVLEPIVGFTENSANVAFYTGSINEDGTSPDLPNVGIAGFPDNFNGSIEFHLVNDIGELVDEHQGFTIDSSGRISLKTGTTLDYETTPTYNLRVRAVFDDGRGPLEEDLHSETWVIINVLDANERAPELGEVQIVENSGAIAGTITGLTGTTADEYIKGTAGADTITSGGGADHIFGGAGNDGITLSSASGSVETIYYRFSSAGTGAWTGLDGVDTITDFRRGEDRLIFIDATDGTPIDLMTFLSNDNVGSAGGQLAVVLKEDNDNIIQGIEIQFSATNKVVVNFHSDDYVEWWNGVSLTNIGPTYVGAGEAGITFDTTTGIRSLTDHAGLLPNYFGGTGNTNLQVTSEDIFADILISERRRHDDGVFATVSATDDDATAPNNEIARYDITGGTGMELFEIDDDGGISVAEGKGFNTESTALTYTLTITATDSGGTPMTSAAKTITIGVEVDHLSVYGISKSGNTLTATQDTEDSDGEVAVSVMYQWFTTDGTSINRLGALSSTNTLDTAASGNELPTGSVYGLTVTYNDEAGNMGETVTIVQGIIDGGVADETLNGDANSTNFIVGGLGVDTINGKGGTAHIWGGEGDDIIKLTEAEGSVETIYYAFTSTDGAWTTTDGMDTITNFRRGEDRLIFVDEDETVITLTEFLNDANRMSDNLEVTPLFSMDDTTLTGVQIDFGGSTALIINYATASQVTVRAANQGAWETAATDYVGANAANLGDDGILTNNALLPNYFGADGNANLQILDDEMIVIVDLI